MTSTAGRAEERDGIDYTRYDREELKEIAPWAAYEKMRESTLVDSDTDTDSAARRRYLVSPVSLPRARVFPRAIQVGPSRAVAPLSPGIPVLGTLSLVLVGLLQESTAVTFVHPVILVPLIAIGTAFSVSSLLRARKSGR